MLYNLRRTLSRKRFDYLIRGILRTPPAAVASAPWRFVSMVGDGDVLMYLLSMKTLYRHVGGGGVTAIVARTMGERSRALLRQHLPGLEFVPIEGIDTGPCQRGGCWERLVHIVHRSAAEFVVQVDCDTLVTGADVDEVKQCIAANASFAYADNAAPIQSFGDTAAEAAGTDPAYVGDALELSMATWDGADRLRYVRASAGFAGFAKGCHALATLQRFHAGMKQALGPRWREWGTEQSASNFMIANSPGSVILPFPAYATFPLPGDNGRAKFLHFIGSNRYRDDYFAEQGRRAIARLHPGLGVPAPARPG